MKLTPPRSNVIAIGTLNLKWPRHVHRPGNATVDTHCLQVCWIFRRCILGQDAIKQRRNVVRVELLKVHDGLGQRIREDSTRMLI
jgi:hypothetical protein